jgi:hypothetical protein
MDPPYEPELGAVLSLIREYLKRGDFEIVRAKFASIDERWRKRVEEMKKEHAREMEALRAELSQPR